jgi:predicted lysophospholipase L1 biosynthesis ABC-type transport system permease subunit
MTTVNQPSRRDRLRPAEYVMLSGVMALFAGLIVLMVTRDPLIAIVLAGLVFVVVIIGIAMLVLAASPNSTPEGQLDSPGTGND